MISLSRERALTVAAALLLTVAPCGAADDNRGAQLAAMCAACHGPAGRPEGIPTVAGQDAEKIKTAMLAYRANERPSHIMHAIALALSDEEIASVAAYLAANGR